MGDEKTPRLMDVNRAFFLYAEYSEKKWMQGMKALDHFQGSDQVVRQVERDRSIPVAKWIKELSGLFKITPEVLMEAGIQMKKNQEMNSK